MSCSNSFTSRPRTTNESLDAAHCAKQRGAVTRQLFLALLWITLATAFASILSLVVGCNRSAPQTAQADRINIGNPREFEEADIRILFLGNSHTYFHDLPQIIRHMIDQDLEPDTAYVEMVAVPDAMLADHLDSTNSMTTLTDKPWDIVVLQGQKYSTTGRYSYPYDAAIEISRIATEQGTRVIMFPEWCRRGNNEEGARVHRLHEEIAAITGADVAPVGLAWDRAIATGENWKLHAPDGNHCSESGAFLTACVLYGTICDRDPSKLDAIDGIEVDVDTQRSLSELAWQLLRESDESSGD